MKPLNVVIAHKDCQCAQSLAASLYTHFKSVAVARSLDEVRIAVPKSRADVAVIDLEMTSLAEIATLRKDFQELDIICTHRLADESLWTEALAAGALDCCHPSDVRSIVLAAQHALATGRFHAA